MVAKTSSAAVKARSTTTSPTARTDPRPSAGELLNRVPDVAEARVEPRPGTFGVRAAARARASGGGVRAVTADPALLGPSRPRSAAASRLGAAAAIGYLGVVMVIELMRASGSGPHIGDLASSPSGVLSGHLWQLLSSGLIVAGDPVLQLAGMSVVMIAALVLLGPGLFWRAAFAGHVLATVIAYAGVGMLWLIARGDVDSVVDAPDYGISCVWAGTLGVLVGAGVRRRGRREMLAAATLAAIAIFVAVIPLTYDLAGAEHALAFALGGLLGAQRPSRSSFELSPVLSVGARRV
jgi:hypothetical protein